MSVSSMGQARSSVAIAAQSPVREVESVLARHYSRRKVSARSGRFDIQVKRALDIMVAMATIIILLPLFCFVALAIKLSSPGPVLFRQVRWGKDERTFEVLKFRTMRTDLCDASGVTQTIKNDPRVTMVGAWLRKSNVDELPQLFNVLKGDMSLVGPRCHPIGMLAAGMPYEQLVHNYHLRHGVRPGITGLAQVRGLRGPTVQASKARQRIACDLYYVRHFSLWLDLKIIGGTIRNELFGGTGF